MSVVWLNGTLSPAGECRIDPADRGFTLGDGIFETLRATPGKLRHVSRHLARMRDGVATLGLGCPWSDEDVAKAIADVLKANALEDAVIRITLTRGPALRGVLPVAANSPTLLVTAEPLSDPYPPARLVIAARTRRNELSPLARLKTLNYLDSIIARREAVDRGADDAVLLNTRGFVAEATAATLVVLHSEQLLTPPVADGALPGIARAILLESGWIAERRFDKATLLTADAALLINSLGTRLVASIDGIQLDEDHPVLETLAAFANQN